VPGSCKNGNEFAVLIKGAAFLDQLNDCYSFSGRPVVTANMQESGTSSSLNMKSHFSIFNTHRRTKERFRPSMIIKKQTYIVLLLRYITTILPVVLYGRET
jgi:hypothetical protein